MFYKQRDMRLYPAWAYTLPTTFLRAFYSATEAGVWSLIVYWTVGFAPEFGRCGAGCCPRAAGTQAAAGPPAGLGSLLRWSRPAHCGARDLSRAMLPAGLAVRCSEPPGRLSVATARTSYD